MTIVTRSFLSSCSTGVSYSCSNRRKRPGSGPPRCRAHSREHARVDGRGARSPPAHVGGITVARLQQL
jgi:hypothetical protein